MNILGIYCGNPQWYPARIGLLTSAKIHDAVTLRQRGGTDDLAKRRKLKEQMIAEMLTGDTTEHYVSQAMQWGIDQEPNAMAAYEHETGLNAIPVGLVMHPTNARFAATTDGWVQEEGGILEIKCPETYTHIHYRKTGVIPPEYLDQIDWQMACCGPEIEWCDFVSYDPRIKAPELRLFIVRRERDQKRIDELEEKAMKFFEELLQEFEDIKRGPISRDDKLRAGIRNGKGQYPFGNDPELARELVP